MHMQRKWSSGVLFSLLFTLVLAACSSGGGDSDSAAPVVPPVVPAGTAEGLWTGTITGHDVRGAVLDDGTYWFLYSEVGNSADMVGALQGNGSMQNGTFASVNGLDFRNDIPHPPVSAIQDIFTFDVTGFYVMEKTLDGTVTYPGGQLAFTSTFDPAYNDPPVITNVEGTYTYDGKAFGFPHTITITVPPPTVPPSGTITVTTTPPPPFPGYRTGGQIDGGDTGIQLGCNFTGTWSLPSNRNVYKITLTPDPTNVVTVGYCNPATLEGVAFFDAAATKIYVLALNSTRSRVFPFTGTRP